MGKILTLDELTLQEVIGILVDFQVQHLPYVHDGKNELGGMVLGTKRIIQLSDSSNYTERQYVTIHELLHAKDILLTGKSKEAGMRERTDFNFRKIFGSDYDIG